MPLQDSDPRAGQVQATEPGEIVGTAHDRPEDADAARASEALVDALREAHELVRSGEVGKTLTDVLWFVALDPAKPTAPAVAVVGDRILAVGELVELNALAGTQPYTVNTTFANQVVVPGFIAQHDHPLLAALTMTSTIIAIEDWVLPQGTSKAARSRDDYLKRLGGC